MKDYAGKRFTVFTKVGEVTELSVFDNETKQHVAKDLPNIWAARLKADELNREHYCHIEAKEGEKFLWNDYVKDFPDKRLESLKTLRAGTTPYSINGDLLQEYEGVLVPVFIHTSELKALDELMKSIQK